MNRRGFLGSILIAGAAPAIVRAEILMPLWTPPQPWYRAVRGERPGLWTIQIRYGRRPPAGDGWRVMERTSAGIVYDSTYTADPPLSTGTSP